MHTQIEVCVGGGFLAQLLAYNIMMCKLFSHMSPRHKASMNLTASKKNLKGKYNENQFQKWNV